MTTDDESNYIERFLANLAELQTRLLTIQQAARNDQRVMKDRFSAWPARYTSAELPGSVSGSAYEQYVEVELSDGRVMSWGLRLQRRSPGWTVEAAIEVHDAGWAHDVRDPLVSECASLADAYAALLDAAAYLAQASDVAAILAEAEAKRAEKIPLKIIETLSKIERLLRHSEHHGQADYVARLVDVGHTAPAEFLADLTTVDMWGGSGAVWEVGQLRSKAETREFWTLIVQLVDQMGAFGIRSNRTEQIAWTFRFWLRPDSPDPPNPVCWGPLVVSRPDLGANGENYIVRKLREKHGGC